MNLSEELQNQQIQNKLTYLNGYLSALEWVNSYSVIGMNYKMFHYRYDGLYMEEAIQNNANELFGVRPNDWSFELLKCNEWKEKLGSEM
ncbi:MAG: hypothetical protein ACPG6V_07765 [Flavobacteriales bacterium]